MKIKMMDKDSWKSLGVIAGIWFVIALVVLGFIWFIKSKVN